MKLSGKYFYGNEISKYGQEHGYLDYRTLAKAFDAVINNDIIYKTSDIGYWEQESGFIDNSEAINNIREDIEMLIEDGYDEEGTEIRELYQAIEDLEEEEQNNIEIMQYFIVSDQGAEILKEIDEIVFYNDALDMYVWGVTHWGTSWDYVLTNVRCNVGYEEE